MLIVCKFASKFILFQEALFFGHIPFTLTWHIFQTIVDFFKIMTSYVLN